MHLDLEEGAGEERINFRIVFRHVGSLLLGDRREDPKPLSIL